MLMRWSVSVVIIVLMAQSGRTQPSSTEKPGTDWPMYRHDLEGSGYSPLAQIDTKNVAKLIQVWTYGLQSDAPPAAQGTGRGGAGGPNSEATPIVVNRVMYLPAANRVVALEPDEGKELWRYTVSGGAPSRRGVAYWAGDSSNRPRIIFPAGRRPIALDANQRAIRSRLGSNGEVDIGGPYDSVP